MYIPYEDTLWDQPHLLLPRYINLHKVLGIGIGIGILIGKGRRP